MDDSMGEQFDDSDLNITEEVAAPTTQDFGLDDINTSDTEALTASQVIELMESAWLNEKFSPEILPHKTEIVDCLLGQISYMEENLENLESNDFQKSLHQMETYRLRYLVTSYLRIRLEKIEMFNYEILKQEEVREEKNEESYLSAGELQFAKEYKENLEQHFDNVLSFWPGLPPDDWKKEYIKPNLHSFVFLKSKTEIEGVIIDDGNEEDGDLVDFKDGSQMIISYNSVSNLVKKGDVQLI